jgi:hypothetical protein
MVAGINAALAGSRLDVTFDAERAHVFDRASGDRLGSLAAVAGVETPSADQAVPA